MSKALIKSVYQINFDEVKYLIKEGADINYIDEQGESAVMVAIGTNNLELVQLLINNGADLNPDPNDVFTLPLCLAVDSAVEQSKWNEEIKEDSIDIIELLVSNGADILSKDKNDESALDLATGYHIPAQQLFERVLNKIS